MPMLLYLSVFTIAISVVLFYYNWKSNKNIIYLSSVFILSSLFGLGHYFMALSDSRFWLAVFYNHFSPLMFLIGPFLYFYIRNTLKVRFTLSKKDWIHFVPALIALIGTIPYSVQPFEKKLANYLLEGLLYIAPLSITAYIIYAVFMFMDNLSQDLIFELFNLIEYKKKEPSVLFSTLT